MGGAFVLRIEDTDRERSTPESIRAILDSLAWLELDWDEGPFFQSERSELYREQLERLLAENKAYRCTCTAEELDEKRKAAMAAGRKPLYDRRCRTAGVGPEQTPHTIRFKAPLAGETIVRDVVKGAVTFPNEELDDLILARSDGSPVYNFCVVVDDALMQITHVIRGEDQLPNTPKQVQIYAALGFPVPIFAHVPLILGLDRTRLSKRHGATSVTAYRDDGYLPDGLNNYLVRLGWSHGDQEIFSRVELIEKFSLETIGTSAGVFNPEKLEWVNFQHLKQLRAADLARRVKPYIEARGWTAPLDDAWLEQVVVLLQERAHTLVQLVDSASYFLHDRIEIDPKAAAKHLAKANRAMLSDLRSALASLDDWTLDGIQKSFEAVLARHQIGLGKLAQPVRVALTGGTVSPGIYEVVHVLGRDRVLARLDHALPLAGSEAQALAGA
jgi:glutamyl-tRNA synthetase